MTVMPTRSKNGWLVRAATVLAVITAGPLVCAQDDLDDDKAADAAIAVLPRVQLDEQGFLRILFSGPKSINAVRAVLEFRLEQQLEVIGRECELTPKQIATLRLAGQGDIKRFLDRVNEVCARFQLAQGDRNQINSLLRESKWLQVALANGVSGDGSLFAKASVRVISREQRAHAAKYRFERERTRHREAIAETVSKLSRSMSLTNDQRQRFVSVLAAETRPPEKSGDSRIAYVMFQAARLPRSMLEPVFDEDQRRLLWKLLESYENIEEFLKDDGFVFDLPPGAPHCRVAPGDFSKPRQPRGCPAEFDDSQLERTATS
jgi:hypothetical protein